MKQEGLSYFTDVHWVLFALILFVLVFGGVIFNAYRKSNKSFFEKMSRLPLEDGGRNE